MKKIKKISLSLTALALVVSAMSIGVVDVKAASLTNTSKVNPMSQLVEALSSKFNLNSSEVQAVVDETMKAHRTEMEAKHKEMFEARLAQAVTDGKLTKVQADLIKAKTLELKSSMESEKESFQLLTKEERKAKIEAKIASLKKWAKDNNIPAEYTHFGGGKGFGGHRGGGVGPQIDITDDQNK